MKQKLHGSYIKYGIGMLAIALCLLSTANSQAASLIWDPGLTGGSGGGGAGVWNEVTDPIPANWYDSTVPQETSLGPRAAMPSSTTPPVMLQLTPVEYTSTT